MMDADELFQTEDVRGRGGELVASGDSSPRSCHTVDTFALTTRHTRPPGVNRASGNPVVRDQPASRRSGTCASGSLSLRRITCRCHRHRTSPRRKADPRTRRKTIPPHPAACRRYQRRTSPRRKADPRTRRKTIPPHPAACRRCRRRTNPKHTADPRTRRKTIPPHPAACRRCQRRTSPKHTANPRTRRKTILPHPEACRRYQRRTSRGCMVDPRSRRRTPLGRRRGAGLPPTPRYSRLEICPRCLARRLCMPPSPSRISRTSLS